MFSPTGVKMEVVMAEEVKDVKKEEVEASATPDVNTESSTEEEVFEGENRSIPYARFKEKAAEAKELKRTIEALKAEKESAVNDTAVKWQSYYEGELARLQRAQAEDVSIYDEPVEDKTAPLLKMIDDLKGKVSLIESQRETEGLKTQIASLKTIYPELEDEHVFVVKKTKPNWSLEECAEYSHKYFEDKMKSKYTAMMAKKKEAAKKPIFTDEGKLNIPAADKPKTFKDAKARMIEYARQLDRR